MDRPLVDGWIVLLWLMAASSVSTESLPEGFESRDTLAVEEILAIRETTVPVAGEIGDVVDDRGRLWIDVIDEPSGKTPWTVVDFETQKIWNTRLPENVSIRSIRDGKIYGVRRDGNGVQEVLAYEIREP